MKKLLVLNVIITALIANFAFADDSVIASMDKAYASGNLTKISQIYNHHKDNRTINYLYAKYMLTKKYPDSALSFARGSTKDYMRNDLIHQLLIFYMGSNQYAKYQSIYPMLPTKLANTNERCGIDLANLIVNNDTSPEVDINWLTNNGSPIWCAKLVASLYNRGLVTRDRRNLMLYNLIASGKTDVFDQIAGSVGEPPILNFDYYMNVPTKKLPKNDFLIIARISHIAYKFPDQAYKELKQSDASSNARAFLENYMGMEFALKHNFDQALDLYNPKSTALSDDEYEWLARSYLYFGNWKKLIATINRMPDSIRTKNVWLYWEATAYNTLHDSANASIYLKQIPNDYSYYSMLANSELDVDTVYQGNPPKNDKLGNSSLASNAKLGLELYRIGKKSHSKNLTTIGSAEWGYAARLTNDDKLLLAMSNLAKKSQFYDLSIYAANQMNLRYIDLSFPLPFWALFTKYGHLFGIPPTYVMSVSRQESRFNYTVIAFDGGVGLMQIMPQTAAYIAHKSGSRNCYRDGAECNIKFGAWYLSSLYDKFENIIYSTAAYNAGSTRPKLWQDKIGKLDNRVQMELIPIAITRDYVQKVISNKAVYDSEIAGNNQIDLASYIEKLGKRHYRDAPDDDDTDAYKLK